MKTFQYRGWDVVLVRGNDAGSSVHYLIHRDGLGKTGTVSMTWPERQTPFGWANTVAHMILWAVWQEDRSRAWMQEQMA